MNGNFMNVLGIIVAEQEEYNAIVKIINEYESKNVYGLEFIVGNIDNVNKPYNQDTIKWKELLLDIERKCC